MTTPSLPAVEARIATDRPGRYLAQLCDHMRQLGAAGHRVHTRSDHGGPNHAGGEHGNGDHADGDHSIGAPAARENDPPPRARRVESTDTEGVIDFGNALCTLSAQDSLLTLRLAAGDPRTLSRLQDAMARTLERVGRRDGLSVVWTARPPEGPSQADPS
jgi:hypothetical protein